MKCWRRNKTQKKSPDPKQTPTRKLNSNVLLESLSMLDLPTSSTSDSMPSSSTSPILPDVNIRVAQEITSLEGSKQVIKTPQSIKSRKVPIQTMQTTDNAVELNIGCPKIIEQNNTEPSQLFTMPVSNNVSTVTTNNSPIITASNITNPSIANNITSQSVANNISSQPIASNIISQSISSTNLKVVNTQTVANNGQMINITQALSNNNQTLGNSNKMILNSITTNVCYTNLIIPSFLLNLN